jgi:hypothetical protein
MTGIPLRHYEKNKVYNLYNFYYSRKLAMSVKKTLKDKGYSVRVITEKIDYMKHLQYRIYYR